jgi:hypothetical protein
MPLTDKSLFDTAILKEEALKELYMLPEMMKLDKEEKAIVAEVAELILIELAQLPFLEGIQKKNCEASLRHAKGILLDIQTIKKLEAQNVILQAIQSVLTRAVKMAIAV